MTFKEMQRIREETYKEQDVPRCETCKYCTSAFRNYCILPAGRGKVISKKVELTGICDLWTERKESA